MKKITLFLFISMFPIITFGLTLNPTTFIASNINNLANGTTVNLQAGIYTLNRATLDAWSAGVLGKSNITYARTGSGTVLIKYSGIYQTEMILKNATNLLFENITFENIKVTYDHCINSTMNYLTSTVQNIDPAVDYNTVALLAFNYGDNCTISNCYLKWTYTGFNGKCVKSYRGTNHKFINNAIMGNLRGAYEIFSDISQPKSNVLVQGGYIERQITGGYEDHGVYFHDVSGGVIDGLIAKGWSETGSGGSIKIKNSDDIEVKNCTFFTSGILLRTGDVGSTWQHLENIYIHDNSIISTTASNMSISTYMTPNANYDNPKALVFDNNKIFNDGITVNNNASLFNQYSSRAGKNGGVYGNGYKSSSSISLTSGINNSGNYVLTTPAPTETGSVSFTSPANGASFASGSNVDITTSTTGVFQYVSIKVDGVWVAQDNITPYTFSLTGLTDGTHTIEVYGKLVDDTWATGQIITINILAPPVTYTEKFESLTSKANTWLSNQLDTLDNTLVWNVNAKVESVNRFGTGTSIYFFEGVSGLKSNSFLGGISSFSVQCKDLWNPGVGRKLNLLINGNVVDSIIHTGTETYTFSVNNINIPGNVSIEIKNVELNTVGNNAVGIDNISWTTYSGAAKAPRAVNRGNIISTTEEPNVFPNPFNSDLKIDSASKFSSATLYDLSGKMIINQSLIGKSMIVLSPSYYIAPEGMYILRLNGENGIKTFKIIRK
ncbi:MAG: T9SS type A sorting domain-containing protein [Bacteroidales bacterium]|nr:T9SS type A sorting domain-containing protein [Bacteroidales bacterium]